MAQGRRVREGVTARGLVIMGALVFCCVAEKNARAANGLVQFSNGTYAGFLDRTLVLDLFVDDYVGFLAGNIRIVFDPGRIRVSTVQADTTAWPIVGGMVDSTVGTVDLRFAASVDSFGTLVRPGAFSSSRIAKVIFQPIAIGATSIVLDAGSEGFTVCSGIDSSSCGNPVDPPTFLDSSVNITTTCVPDPGICLPEEQRVPEESRVQNAGCRRAQNAGRQTPEEGRRPARRRCQGRALTASPKDAYMPVQLASWSIASHFQF